MLIHFADNDFVALFADVLLTIGNKGGSDIPKYELVEIVNQLSWGFYLLRHYQYSWKATPDPKLKGYLEVFESPKVSEKDTYRSYILVGDEVENFFKTEIPGNSSYAFWYPGQLTPEYVSS